MPRFFDSMSPKRSGFSFCAGLRTNQHTILIGNFTMRAAESQPFRMEKGQQSILGRAVPAQGLQVVKDGGDVDAITAATISSRAFLNAVNRAYSAFAGVDGLTSATPSSDNN